MPNSRSNRERVVSRSLSVVLSFGVGINLRPSPSRELAIGGSVPGVVRSWNVRLEICGKYFDDEVLVRTCRAFMWVVRMGSGRKPWVCMALWLIPFAIVRESCVNACISSSIASWACWSCCFRLQWRNRCVVLWECDDRDRLYGDRGMLMAGDGDGRWRQRSSCVSMTSVN